MAVDGKAAEVEADQTCTSMIVADPSERRLPPGWRMVKFGDLVRQVSVAVRNPAEAGLDRVVGLEHIDSDDLHIKRWDDIGEGTSFSKRFRKGQVLFGRRRAYLRKVAYAEFDGICSGDITVLEQKGDGLLPELLPFVVQTEGFYEHTQKVSAGGLSPRAKWRDLATYEFALPPISEQRRIAEILWAAEKAEQRLRDSEDALGALDEAVLDEWMDKGSGEGWREATLDDVCSVQQGQVDPTEPPYRDMIHIAPDDIEGQTGRILECKTAAQDSVQSGNYAFTSKAVLFSKIRPNLRKVAMPGFDGVCSADMYPVFPKNSIRRAVLWRLLLGSRFTAYACVHSVRGAIPKLNRQELLSYRFRLPTIEEQDCFLASGNSIAAVGLKLRDHIAVLVTARRSLASRLLDGRR
jgi:type I restriction enzyme, S subunit